ncbi:MAG: HAMP domain-containing protein, partial [Deltaproteobacteria bacterium]|nr:HAMP domain-containing protein [Deltaproteobacteria bacterium]
MNSFRNIPIKHKLTMIIMLTAIIVLILSSVSFVANDVRTLRQAMIDNLSTLADIIGSNSTAALTFNDRASAEETLSALKDEPHIISACIYQKSGKKFAEYIRQGVNRDLLSPGPEENGYRFKDDHLILFQKINLDGEIIGKIYLQSDLQGMYSRLREYVGIVAFIMLFVSVVAFLLSSTSQRVISGPILRLAHTARTISRERNYAIRAEKQSGDEIGDLIDGFNEMLTQIQDRDVKLELHRNRLE